MEILSCEKLTIEQALRLNLENAPDADPCLDEELNKYKTGYDDELFKSKLDFAQSLLNKSKEYQNAYETMDENEVKFWDYIMLTKMDMYKMWQETYTKYEQEKSKCSKIPYTIENLKQYLHNNNIFIVKTDRNQLLLVTDIGDALIITALNSDLSAYDSSLCDIDYDILTETIIEWYQENSKIKLHA